MGALHQAQAPIYQGHGSINYPKGNLRYVWDGRGTAGASARCTIEPDQIRLAPVKPIGVVLGWPEIVLPLAEISSAEELFFHRYRFRLADDALDGACFRPVGSRQSFLIALEQVGLPVDRLPRTNSLRAELEMLWGQFRWGGRQRRRSR